MKLFKGVLPFLLAGVMIVALLVVNIPLVTYGDNLSELQRKQEQLKREMEANKAKQAEAKRIHDEVVRQTNDLDRRINVVTKDLEDAKIRLDYNTETLMAVERELFRAEHDTEVFKQELDDRIRLLYMRGKVDYIGVVFAGEDFSDILRRATLVSALFQKDIELLELFYLTQLSIEEQRDYLLVRRSEILDIKAKIEDLEEELRTARLERVRYMETMKDTIAILEEQEEQFLKESNELTELIKKIMSERQYAGGKLTWPAPGYYTITSHFGMRVHPIYGSNRFHVGMDIAVPMNKNIVAAADGVVRIAGWLGSYGNAVLIDHGSKLATLYAHNTSILVNLNQEVKRGQVIAKSGSTGMSTGPHLHFEVRVDGEYKNPLDFLERR